MKSRRLGANTVRTGARGTHRPGRSCARRGEEGHGGEALRERERERER